MNSNIVFKKEKVFITNLQKEIFKQEIPIYENKINELIKYFEEIFNANDLSEFSYEKLYFLVLAITREKGGNKLRENIIDLLNKILKENIQITENNFDVENIIDIYENLSEKIFKISKIL